MIDKQAALDNENISPYLNMSEKQLKLQSAILGKKIYELEQRRNAIVGKAFIEVIEENLAKGSNANLPFAWIMIDKIKTLPQKNQALIKDVTKILRDIIDSEYEHTIAMLQDEDEEANFEPQCVLDLDIKTSINPCYQRHNTQDKPTPVDELQGEAANILQDNESLQETPFPGTLQENSTDTLLDTSIDTPITKGDSQIKRRGRPKKTAN